MIDCISLVYTGVYIDCNTDCKPLTGCRPELVWTQQDASRWCFDPETVSPLGASSANALLPT